MILFGEFVLYGDIIECVGLLMSGVCVVGGVVGCNLVLIIVLCYCVVGVLGSLIGYVGGIDCKCVLLLFEGVEFVCGVYYLM